MHDHSGGRPIFVVGCPRSGTTLLQVMLHSHPRIAIPPETRYLVDAYRGRARFGDLSDPEARRELATFITRSPRFRDLGLGRKATVRRIVDGSPTVGSAVATVLAGYAGRHGKARWGDKRPGYFQDLRIILRMFPDAQIVHLVRDGRDCVASLKRMRWFTEDSTAAMVMWVRAVDAGHRARNRLSNSTFHELRYEDLVTDPEPALRRLCDFLGEEFVPEMADPAPVAQQAVPQRKTWHERTRGPVEGTAIRHGAGLEPWERALMERVARSRLQLHGYPVGPPEPVPPARWLHYQQVRAVKAGMTWRRHLEDRVIDLRLRDDVAAR